MRPETAHPEVQPTEFGTAALMTWIVIASISVIFAAGTLMLPADSFQSQPIAASSLTVNSGDKPQVVADAIEAVEPSQPGSASTPLDETSTNGPVDQSQGADRALFSKPTEPVTAVRLGADLGGSTKISELLTRFIAMRSHAPELFKGVLPLVFLNETENTFEARLIAGPFVTDEEFGEFCKSIRLRLSVKCEPAAYEGDDLL